MDTKQTAVTVFYDRDFDFMRLQARSFALYVPEQLFSRIILIDNSSRGGKRTDWQRLIRTFGRHAPIVEIHDAKDISPMPAMEGWMTQQVLKLAIAKFITTDHYILLDAKNHFVYPIDMNFFYSRDNIPYIDIDCYLNHPLHDFLTRSLNIFGLEKARYISQFYQTITPFVMYTDVVRELIAELERRERKPFSEVLRDRLVTEFFTYEAFICWRFGTITNHYQVRPIPKDGIKDVVWPEMNDFSNINKILNNIEETKHQIFSFHRRAGRGLSRDCQNILTEFWIRHGLIKNKSEGRLFFARQRVRLWSEATSILGMRVARKAGTLMSRAGLTGPGGHA
jgi:hypothetical protein